MTVKWRRVRKWAAYISVGTSLGFTIVSAFTARSMVGSLLYWSIYLSLFNTHLIAFLSLIKAGLEEVA